MIRKLLLVGGDRRAMYLEALLRQEGYSVHTLGLHAEDERTATPSEMDALVFAYPFSARGGSVPTMTGLTVHPQDVLNQAATGTLVLAGRGVEKQEGFLWKAYSDAEGLEEANAEISAEAAVCEAMQRMERTLMDSVVLVTGYGRFGRAVARRLKALGAEVWAAARREEQRLLAASDGVHPIALSGMADILPQVHMVMNTIPAQVMGDGELQAMQTGSWLMELASAPYGFDRTRAAEHGLHCDVLPALPARYAPLSAALAWKKAAVNMLKEAEA